MKCAVFEEHSSSCVVYSRFSGTLFPVSMIDGESGAHYYSFAIKIFVLFILSGRFTQVLLYMMKQLSCKFPADATQAD